MKDLQTILSETDFTQEEFLIYLKVQKNCIAEDLQELKEEYNENEQNIINNYADLILDKYNAWMDDWRVIMREAINFAIQESKVKNNKN